MPPITMLMLTWSCMRSIVDLADVKLAESKAREPSEENGDAAEIGDRDGCASCGLYRACP